MHYLEIKELASRFRRNPTKAEQKLWLYLKGKHLKGRKFLRQHPIVYQVNKRECFFFIPDFYCVSEHLVIELDGGIHDDRKEKDLQRDRILSNFGLKILRIKNEELINIESVLLRIIQQFYINTPSLG
ncbi:MAG: DUF559 domain-containing protein [Bacteroidota bacterium]